MSNKKSYIDSQRLARQYKVGDTVLLPIHTRGNRYAPSVGRVTAVLDKIGFLDIETPFGNIRLSAEWVVKENRIDTSYMEMEDTSISTWERERAKKVASSYYKKRFKHISRKAAQLRETGLSEMESYNFIFSRHSSIYTDDEIKEAVKVAYPTKESQTKQALYWKAKGRRYVPTKSEVEEGCFSCPKCKCDLKKTHYKKNQQLYACPECLWLITPKDLLEKGCEPEPLDGDKKDVIDFFSPNDPLLRELYGDEDGED